MIPQSVQVSGMNAQLPPHLHISLETCPTCGQDIPPDKVEEINGKIAAREREQALAITAQLEKQHASERSSADARAKAELESERQQSAAREAQMRQEAQEDAAQLVSKSQAEAAQARQELEADWKHQLEEAESKRKLAEQLESGLQDELKELRKTSASALESARAEARTREAEIQDEARRTAEASVAERIAAMDVARRESEAGLQARIAEAEATTIAAKEKETTLASQLDALRTASEAEVERVKGEAASETLKIRQGAEASANLAKQNEASLTLQLDEQRKAQEAEVAKLKEDSAADALRIRHAATEAAEALFRDELVAKETALVEANAKASDAEQRELHLTEQHSVAMRTELGQQREILEKDKEAAVNAEKAHAFEEHQKLSTRLGDMQRLLDKKTADELGEGAEVDVFEALKKEFTEDTITRIKKGAPGADVRHVVMHRGRECGTILYDSKNRNKWEWEYVSKLKADQLADRAEHAILSTNRFPKGTCQLHNHDGVVIANPARVVAIATIFRQHLLKLHTLHLSEVERENKTAALYEFITSEQCEHLLGRIEKHADDLLDMQGAEVRWHEKNWGKQGEAIRAIQKAKVNLEMEISLILGTSADENAISEAS
jgi:hypothetical protein